MVTSGELIAVFVDERNYLVVGRSSSAAKKAEALRRISFARRRSRLPAQLLDPLGFNGAQPGGFAAIASSPLPSAPQGVW